ncbi:ARM repeat-containing protein [Amylostereum chailletii]|nr:ARM repeat-containing protein [Amylostereum chailletii]
MAATTKAPKKRSAPTSSGPAAKKAHLDPSARAAPKKRAKPVVQPESDISDSDAGEDDDEWAESEGGISGGDNKDDEMAVDGAERPPKDPNAARESHKAQRALLDQRRSSKPNSALLADAKLKWALARQKNLSKAERRKHVGALMDVIRGKVQEIVFKHDASRIVQTVVKWGDQATRDAIALELKGRYRELAQNRYSKFLVTKLARLCPSHRLSMILEFKGNVIRLLLHREASRALADIYEVYANGYERALLLRDFYGRETALFSGTFTAGSEEDKVRARKGLRGVLEGLEVDRKKRVLGALKENLESVFNNSEKGSVRHAIVHRALWEYLSEVNELPDAADREKLRREMLEGCQEILAEMVHTKDGSRVVREFLAQGTAKDRKQTIKVIKPYIETMAKDDEAQLVLFTALDVTDDTKLLAKSLLPSITSHASTLHSSSAGRRALLYPLVPRSRKHFTPALTASLGETDAIREITSRKAADVRAAEVRAAASPDLLSWIEKEGATLSRETGGSLAVIEVMLEAEGDKKVAMETLLKPLSSPYPASDATNPHPIDLPHTSRLYKTLLQGGHYSHSANSVEPSPRFSSRAFAEAFVAVVGQERTLEMARGGGAFVVAELLERVRAECEEEVRKTVEGWFGGFEEKDDGSVKGWAVLVGKLRALREASAST